MTDQDRPLYAKNIHRALDRRSMSVRRLAELMKDRDVRGASYGGVRLYADGGVKNPRTETLEAIAEVLNVRKEWLIRDEGPMTEAEAARQEEVERIAEEGLQEVRNGTSAGDARTPRAREKEALKGAILEIAGSVGSSVDDIPYWVDGLIEVFKRAARSDPLESSVAGGDDFIDLVAAIRDPLEALGVDFETMRDRDGTAWADYITAITPALFAIVAERERQRSEEARVVGRQSTGRS